MKKIYETQGTCAKAIAIDINDETGLIDNVQFYGGCNGNTQGVAALVKGQKPQAVIERLSGIRCGMKPTSCPDQLAQALKMMTE